VEPVQKIGTGSVLFRSTDIKPTTIQNPETAKNQKTNA